MTPTTRASSQLKDTHDARIVTAEGEGGGRRNASGGAGVAVVVAIAVVVLTNAATAADVGRCMCCLQVGGSW